jgi:hypothetical protein
VQLHRDHGPPSSAFLCAIQVPMPMDVSNARARGTYAPPRPPRPLTAHALPPPLLHQRYKQHIAYCIYLYQLQYTGAGPGAEGHPKPNKNKKGSSKGLQLTKGTKSAEGRPREQLKKSDQRHQPSTGGNKKTTDRLPFVCVCVCGCVGVFFGWGVRCFSLGPEEGSSSSKSAKSKKVFYF